MARPSKSLTCAFKVRMTDAERAAIVATVEEYAQCGITLSLNDAARAMLRRAAAPLCGAPGPLREAIIEHQGECEWCTTEAPRCPEGKRMMYLYGGMAALEKTSSPPPAPPRPAPAPSPSPTAPPAAPADLMMPPWRRGFQG